MKRQMHDNSLYAYAVLNESGTRLNMRQKVMKVVHEHPNSTVHDICAHLGKYPHQVSGRLTELKACKALIVSGKRKVDGFPCDTYLTNVAVQQRLL